VGAISLREVARRAGVSHAAPAHHFGDKAGLLTALACEGFEHFADALRAGAAKDVQHADQRLSWVGHAYIMFAVEHRAYFEIMFRPELLRDDDGALARASLGAYAVLKESVRAAYADKLESADDFELQAIRAWSEVHGLATLWLHGNLSQHASRAELDRLARRLLHLA
jgi:AcrR family transcriptional regulator